MTTVSDMPVTPAVEVRDLRFSYGNGVESLRGVSFAVAPGECIGLIGPNGAGKSTLLLHLNGLLPEQFDDSKSSVLISGQPVTTANLPTIRRQVGLLFQDPNDQLFCPTVFEDVAFGPQQLGLAGDQLRARVTQSLAQMRLDGFEQREPHHLSSGEKRRVCLAGLLACEPSVLVLDEPTSNLDPRGRREIKDLLTRIPVTKIIATHDLELVVQLCARVILLSRGQVVTTGPTVQILSDEKLMLEHDLERPHILQHQHPHGFLPLIPLPPAGKEDAR
jgi:energy-coupling factor transporter ATP-binding protein EcfA2